MISYYNFVIETWSYSSFFLSTGALEDRVTPDSNIFAWSIVKQLKVIYLVNCFRRWKTDFVTNSRTYSQHQRKQAFLIVLHIFYCNYIGRYILFSLFPILIQLFWVLSLGWFYCPSIPHCEYERVLLDCLFCLHLAQLFISYLFLWSLEQNHFPSWQ